MNTLQSDKNPIEPLTWHIHIEGQVQGVGFRPFIYQLAQEFHIEGWVNNTWDGVHIEFNASNIEAQSFYQMILKKAPVLSIITHSSLTLADPVAYQNFSIIKSNPIGEPSLLLTPDFGICESCTQDLHDDKNRRHEYAFTTCTLCGPRYSIIRSLPYDRETTSMEPFQMCMVCLDEYQDPLDRRFYAQTNSCPDCAIPMQLLDRNQKVLCKNPADIITRVIILWEAGNIVAIKGIGGYLLTCKTEDPSVIKKLRQRKNRPSKPFAVMFPNQEALIKEVQVTKEEIDQLKGPTSPIILLPLKDPEQSMIAKNEIAPGLLHLGIMLPYAPLFEMLLSAYKKPVVATSGNISNAAIIYQDDQAIGQLLSIADYLLWHSRQIVIPQDDSVIKYTPQSRTKIIIRRSRGMAPTYINPSLSWSNATILATGAMLKSTFSYVHQNNVYISQYLGDLQHYDTFLSMRHTIQHYFDVFGKNPQKILCDLHPQYESTRYAQSLAKKLNVPVIPVQHHEAHFAAILGEANLIHSNALVLGVVWDGTGLGTDQQIWGGEFFTYQQYKFKRYAHFAYFDFILGDKMPKEPRISALSLCHHITGAEEFLREKFSTVEWTYYNQLLSQNKALSTSSVGRIFDAVASLLGLADKQTFEGEAAMLLENLAWIYLDKLGPDHLPPYNFLDADGIVNTKILFELIIGDLMGEVNREHLAAKFHVSLAYLIKQVADKLNCKQIAFSGGVFQNSVLVDLLSHILNDEYELYFHQQLSPNDECVSFGQLVFDQIQDHKKLNFDRKQ